ncbi:FAD-binding oxidoreductase [Nocardioides aromaticivorans]|uniref:FAD-binding oxidoreductase n=1 Tax=Nocardioides aromaticivorans TaxID=200618 RepID=A0ABX7PTC5_9ACTN|nr:FAD-binding oxidoreductase [Nocardioides aromaticivorans]QSR28883.1 FAD-binding oxidoreductase [Nocardioides aromaticivorans]
MGRVRRVAKILRRAGTKVELGTSEELGIPRGFVGGMHETEGGILNPGKLTRVVRRALLESSARVFEQTKITDVVRTDGRVVLSTPGGQVRAGRVVFATNAFAGEWDITPRHLSVPLWVIEVETAPIDPDRLMELGWTSRSALVTQHNIMENYRLTSRNTIVFGVRRIERGKDFPLPMSEKSPDPALVDELAGAFAHRFPSLADVRVARSWGGWIATTPSWLPVAGQIDGDVFYSVACNGHGLAQAPYVGTLIADLLVDGVRPADLDVLWADKPRFPRPFMMSPLGLRRPGPSTASTTWSTGVAGTLARERSGLRHPRERAARRPRNAASPTPPMRAQPLT